MKDEGRLSHIRGREDALSKRGPSSEQDPLQSLLQMYIQPIQISPNPLSITSFSQRCLTLVLETTYSHVICTFKLVAFLGKTFPKIAYYAPYMRQPSHSAVRSMAVHEQLSLSGLGLAWGLRSKQDKYSLNFWCENYTSDRSLFNQN